jgi:hypothetical protein
LHFWFIAWRERERSLDTPQADFLCFHVSYWPSRLAFMLSSE